MSTPTSLQHHTCALCGHDAARHRYPLKMGAIVSCVQCGFSFVDPRLSSEFLQQKLQDWAQQDVVDEARLSVAFAPATIDFFSAYLDQVEAHHEIAGRHMLDVGCATGALLTVARERGWEVEGVELGKASAHYSREVLGLNVHNRSLFDFTPTTPFDLVSFLEVIEHLESPKDALLRIHELLRPEGLLLLSTPNFDSLFRRLFGTDWWVVNCEDEHIMFFTPASLTRMLRETGFEIVSLRTRSIDLPGLARTLKNRLRPHKDATADGEHGYYAARDGKENVKAWLNRLGIIGIARMGLKTLDHLFSWRFSPLFGMGEQLVVIARRK